MCIHFEIKEELKFIQTKRNAIESKERASNNPIKIQQMIQLMGHTHRKLILSTIFHLWT